MDTIILCMAMWASHDYGRWLVIRAGIEPAAT